MFRGKRGPYTARGIERLVAELGRRAQVPNVHPHLFRHDASRLRRPARALSHRADCRSARCPALRDPARPPRLVESVDLPRRNSLMNGLSCGRAEHPYPHA